MEKIKILVAPGDNAGSGKFRCIDPHVNLQNNFSEQFHVDINHSVDFSNIDYLKQYQIIFIHRTPQHQIDNALKIIGNIKKLGIKLIVDSDDYWELDPSHGLYQAHKLKKIPEISLEIFKLADAITVSTKILADAVKKFNKNVFVIPNAIDPNENQFIPNPTESERVRFGWLGGSSHIKDLQIINGFGNTIQNYTKIAQTVLCGFDTRGTVRFFDKETNQMKERPMQPMESTWFMYETFLTNSYRYLQDDVEYVKYLMKFKYDEMYNDKDKPYRRIWTKPINKYANGYNEFDIALAPLNSSKFNLYKSQLKIIEAGFHKKPVIVQDYGPYTLDLVNAYEKGGVFNDNGNALLVDPIKNHKQWNQYAKKLIENKNLRTDLGERLYETVSVKYNLNNVTKNRAEIYLSLFA